MNRRTQWRAIVVVVAVLAAVSCSTAGTAVTESSSNTATTVSGLPAVCGPLGEVNDLNTEVGEIMALNPAIGSQALSNLQKAFRQALPLLDDTIDAYRRALQVAPPELRADIATLEEVTPKLTRVVFDHVLDAERLDELDFETVLSNPTVVQWSLDGATAALRLDEYTVPECGFRLSNSP